MQTFLMNIERKHVIAVIICAVLMIAGIIVHGIVVGKAQTSYDVVNSEMASLQSQIDVVLAAQNTEAQQVSNQATGIDKSRFLTDEKAFHTVLNTMVGWDSYKSYNEVRTTLIDTYGMSSTSEFMTTFFPEMERSGNSIDGEKLRLSAADEDVQIVTCSGDRYTYMAKTSLTQTKNDDKAKAVTTPVIMMFTVDSKGNVSDLSGEICVS